MWRRIDPKLGVSERRELIPLRRLGDIARHEEGKRKPGLPRSGQQSAVKSATGSTLPTWAMQQVGSLSGVQQLLIQRQFEDPDDHLCYVETHDEKYIGHFLPRRVEFTLHGLSIELDRPNDNLLNVTFTMAPSDFEEASRIVKIMPAR